MRLINPSVELYLQEDYTLEGIYKQIERCARVSYKSEDKITENSSKEFVDRLIKSKHLSPLEHGTVYLHIIVYPTDTEYYEDIVNFYYGNPYSVVAPNTINGAFMREYYITTNYRVIIENHLEDDLQYLCTPAEYHERRISLKFITDIGVTRECNRHRAFSVTEMSTRYCNYSKDKFGNEITYIIPSWLDIPEGEAYWLYGRGYRIGVSNKDLFGTSVNLHNFEDAIQFDRWLSSLDDAERRYLDLIEEGRWTPQQAREVLPLATKTEVVYTGFSSDWKHFFDLRLRGTTGAPHPNCKQVAQMAWDKLKEINYKL